MTSLLCCSVNTAVIYKAAVVPARVAKQCVITCVRLLLMRISVYSTAAMSVSAPDPVVGPGHVETPVLIALLTVLLALDVHFLCTIKV